MSKRYFPKLIVTFALVFLFSFMLTGCSKGNSYPKDGIEYDKAYLTNGTVTLTVGELYENLKTDYGLDLLEKLINKQVFKEQIEKYNANEAEYREFLEYYVDEACYQETDKDKLAELDNDVLAKSQKAFLESLITFGVDIDLTQNSDGLYDIYQESVAQYFIADIAIKIFAKELATKEWNGLVELTDDGIIDLYEENELTDAIKAEIEETQTDKIVKKYISDHKEKGDMYGLLIRFTNKTEYNETLKLLCLKAVGGKWYQIPYTETDDFDSYYANYAIDKDDVALTDVEVFANFIIMYNFLNSYRSSIVNDMGWSSNTIDEIVNDFKTTDRTIANACIAAIKADAGNEDGSVKFGSVNEDTLVYTPSDFITNLLSFDEDGDFVLEYDEFYTDYTTIYNHFKNTLKTTGQKFSTSGIEYTNKITGSSSTFLGFKLAENMVTKLYNETTTTYTDADGEEAEKTVYTFLDTEAAKELKQTIIDEIIDYEVYLMTDGDYSQLVQSKYAYDGIYKKNLKIYDADLQLLYAKENALYKKTSSTSSSAIAVINDVEITAKDFCDELVNLYGPIVSLSLVFDKYLVAEYENGYFEGIISDKELNTACENAFNNYMNAFAQGQDQLSGYQLPASIGKKAYMSIAFKANTMKEAVNEYFKPLVLKELYYDNLDLYYETKDGLDPYEVMAEYAQKEFEEYFSLTYQNLLIYIDMNGDEELEDPNEYLATLTETEATEFKALIEDFADAITAKVEEGTSLANGLSNFATEYNKANLFDETWGKYKKAGLFIKLEASATSTTGASLVEPFYNRLVEVYNDATNWDTVENYRIEGSFVPFFDHEIGKSYDTIVCTEFGYHLVLFTAAGKKPNAEFDSENAKYQNITYNYKNEDGEIYNTVVVKDVLSENAYPSRNQIEVYVRDNELYGSNLNLFTETYTNVKSSLEKVYTRYTSSTHRTLAIIDVLISEGFNFSDKTISKRVNTSINVTINQLDSYKDAEDNIYLDWFEDFGYNSKFAE